MDFEQEKQLVERSRDNSSAFGLLYDEYYGKIFGYILCRTNNVAASQDITSQVFFKALKNINSFHWRGIPFSAWLYRIAGNEVANFYTRNGQNKVLANELKLSYGLLQTSLEEEILRAEAEQEQNAKFAAVHSCISKLPVKFQEVISLRFFEKKQIHEIADILGKRQGTVKSLLHRALERMRTMMNESGATF